MKNNRLLIFMLLFIGGTLFLLPNFYDNKWRAVEPAYYDEWQTQYDRLVIARLVKTRQDGFFSAGGLLGLGDTPELNYLSATHRRQYSAYLNNENFKIYTVYKSNPGFQGVLYGIPDRLLTTTSNQKIDFFRGFAALASAIAVSLLFTGFVIEFGFLSGMLPLLFAAFCIWTILPAGSIFWNLWAFYLPFLASIYLLADSERKGIYNPRKVYFVLFTATLARILLSGFDIITTGLIMTTVPIVFYGIYKEWSWNTFINRFLKISLALSAATLTGLFILSAQIISNHGNIRIAFDYIEERFGHHFAGNSQYYLSGGIEPTKIGIIEVTKKYLLMPAMNVRLPGPDIQILYWHLIILFATCTTLFFILDKKWDRSSRKAIALIVATWYSLLAPLSWYILFRPHSIIHTRVNTMGWQMPFTLLGFALCGYVASDLLKRKTT
ncbi:MAG TPA: hypothetical protein VJ987_01225 [Anaerolineales bacterium]|nr:hypothetical protein [Anaerolineales bacterium]